MDNKIINVCMLMIGVSIGSIITYKIVDKKYETKIQEEIDLFKKDFIKRPTIGSNVSEMYPAEIIDEEKPAFTKKDRDNAKNIVENAGYTNYSQYANVDNHEDTDSSNDFFYANDQPVMSIRPEDTECPYVIAPEEFGDLDSYEKISLAYFADGILANENDEQVDDIDDLVGCESLEHFGEYEDDSVFVRNDKLKSYYEILKDNRRWVDVVDPPKSKPTRNKTPMKPHQMEE